jgi:hypothetical protein
MMAEGRISRFGAIRSPALWVGIASGSAYGMALRSIAAFAVTVGVMSLAFIFVVPLVIGYLAVRPHASPSIAYRLFAPWLPTLLGCGLAMLVGMEGAICVVLGIPVMLVCASIGGLIGGVRAARRPSTTAAMLALPLAIGAAEGNGPGALDHHRVATSIEIDAPAADVWREIVSVREISPNELSPALYLRLGFPRPLSAEIRGEGIGAVRMARFAGGVLFVETVNDWAPESRLGFRIAAQTDQIPPTTLDPHVTIGGPHFDVIQGTYRIESLGPGRVRLHLASDLWVATHFNWYASLWANAIMRSIQRTILEVEKARAEQASRRSSGV